MQRVKPKTQNKETNKNSKTSNITSKRLKLNFTFFLIGSIVGIFFLLVGGYLIYEYKYRDRIYSGIQIDHLEMGGKTRNEVENYFSKKSFPLSKLNITFYYQDTIATISAQELELAYDGKLSADQAYSLGRSGHIISDTYQKLYALKQGLNLPVTIHINNNNLNDFLSNLADRIDVAPEDALFKFENNRVTAFKLSQFGKRLNQSKTKYLIDDYLHQLIYSGRIDNYNIRLALPVEIVNPEVTTENSNNLGIKELIGHGSSKFAHSIPGRIHNVALAASRINGRLIAPKTNFSFNDALGDVSSTTGFEQAYIIKDGKTILGDGGGVCQVSTTLFRAALNAGLPITERWAHAYRVGYYEEDSPPGLDATVYAPSNDLKIKNDTGNYILIQANTDLDNLSLSFDLYGTSDGRVATITTPRVYAQQPPPPDLFQDDPTLPMGTIKQTDFAAWGAKVDFDYQVTRGGQIIYKQNFFSNYRPWQAIYLRGTKT